MAPVPDVTLYLATDPVLIGERDIRDIVAAAISGGVTMVQLRDKTATGRSLYETARRLLGITRSRNVPLIVNDRVDVMLAAGADGVHIGPEDLPLQAIRELAGTRILGLSVNTLADLDQAHRQGADYVGIGPVFPTSTKPDTRELLGTEGLAELARRAKVPCVAIGGIRVENCAQAIRNGADGVCAISGLLTENDVARAARRFRRRIADGRTGIAGT